MVGDFHKLDRFGEIVFGDEKGEVSAPKADVAKDDKAAKGDKGDKAGKADKAKGNKKAAPAKKAEAAK
jgi:hypothetical protein